ncbi:DUF4935 domain-containing protein [Listeria booriae]|uniref:PIN-like domain-containing protein n=1 Tax=Listeria booriae TaxID=1552123 RepID=UPI001628DF4B|nr:PIN domain-containing protein [Listeria booriae]MBC1523578.1 DUF4935 domain-containing protein [Listeria booriae]
MKNEFKEFYTNKIDISNPDESVLLVLDTNVLLNIYRFSEVTRTVFLDSLTKLKDNLFIPYQIGLEYNLNRQDAISKSKNAKNDLYSELDKIATKFANEIRMQIDKVSVKSTDYTVERNKIKNKLEDKTKSLIEKLKKNELNDLFGLLDTETDMSYRLAEILEGKVGPSYNQSELNDIEEKGKKRYECEIPPGFGDLANKKDKITYYNNLEIKKEYGDLIIWYQILEKAKEDQIKSVIFVSDDSQKNDWTYKQKGARAELKKEMLETSNAEFVILGSNQFIEQANPTKNYKDIIDTVSMDLDTGKNRNIYDGVKTSHRLVRYNPSMREDKIKVISEKLLYLQEEVNNLIKAIDYTDATRGLREEDKPIVRKQSARLFEINRQLILNYNLIKTDLDRSLHKLKLLSTETELYSDEIYLIKSKLSKIIHY